MSPQMLFLLLVCVAACVLERGTALESIPMLWYFILMVVPPSTIIIELEVLMGVTMGVRLWSAMPTLIELALMGLWLALVVFDCLAMVSSARVHMFCPRVHYICTYHRHICAALMSLALAVLTPTTNNIEWQLLVNALARAGAYLFLATQDGAATTTIGLIRYGIVLIAPSPWVALFGFVVVFAAMRLTRHTHGAVGEKAVAVVVVATEHPRRSEQEAEKEHMASQHHQQRLPDNNGNSGGASDGQKQMMMTIHELDVVEAFRLAKAQYGSHHPATNNING